MTKSDWKKCKLGDVISIKHGFAFKGDFFVETPTPYILVTPGNFNIGGGFKDAKLKYYNGPIPQDYILKPGDVIVTMTDLSKAGDTLGYSALVPELKGKILLHNQRIGLVLSESISISKQFIYWLMREHNYQQYIVNTASGSTVKHTSPSRIEAFEFLLPPIEEQKRIAGILGSLDDKIELLQKQNKTLEDMAKAIFKSWFVDFDIVRAKQQGRPKADIMREYYLTDELYDLFPSDFENSSLGPIPLGWQVKNITELIEFEKGIEPGAKNYTNIPPNKEYVPFYRVQDISSYGNQCKTFVDKSLLKGKLFSNDDIVVSLDATLGRVCIGTQGGFSSGIRKVISKSNDLSKTYILCFLKSDYFLQMLDKYAGAETTIKHAGKAVSYLQIVYDKNIINKFNHMTEKIFPKILQNIKQMQTLTELRDTLLPPLISGKIRV
ncbi:restriction endonuclease subunit S [Candidatus Proelusimicrobium excrementi]|uniref:restriction endonuclease subunit S n=1 Tax=Candidatus Proelusimicrobium excrementi TaxID=3416222 RepID=UPI003CB6D5D6|nr:restriction endonuclease subunit S [Elusimicrobiaceae bacterium]